MTRLFVPFATATAVFALGNALSTHSWSAIPLFVLAAAGIVLLAQDAEEPDPSTQPTPTQEPAK